MTIETRTAADQARLLFNACTGFQDGLAQLYEGLGLIGKSELGYYSAAAISAALALQTDANSRLREAFDRCLLEIKGRAWFDTYQRRLTLYGPLLLENARTVEVTGELAALLSRQLPKSPSNGPSGHAIATYSLVALELVAEALGDGPQDR